MEQKKQKKRYPVFGVPYLGPILLFFVYELILNLISDPLDKAVGRPALFYISAVVGLLIFLFQGLYFHKEWKGGFATSALRSRSLWILLVIYFLFDIGDNVYDIFRDGFSNITWTGIGISLMAAFCEESVFRYAMIGLQMRSDVKKNTYLPSLILSSVVFGLLHFGNLAAGASLSMTVLQVVAAIGTGFLFGAIFLRTGNITFTIVLHFLHDLMCSLVLTASDGVYKGDPSLAVIIECILLFFVYLLFAFLLLKGQKGKIVALWKDQWGRDSSPEAEEKGEMTE